MSEDKYIFLVWECDQWKRYDSMILVQVTDTFEKAVDEIMNNITLYESDYCNYDGTKEEQKEYLKEYIKEYLLEYNQTPELKTNYVIQQVAVNGVWKELIH